MSALRSPTTWYSELSGLSGGVHELRARGTVVLLLETIETTLEAFGRGRGPIWLHTVASLPASRSEGDPPSIDMGVPRRLQRERGSGRSYSSGREGERATRAPWSPLEAQQANSLGCE